MMVLLLGGSYLGSRSELYLRNPLSSTIDEGWRLVAIISTSASSVSCTNLNPVDICETKKHMVICADVDLVFLEVVCQYIAHTS